MKKLLLLALLSMIFSAMAKDSAVNRVKAGLAHDEDIRNICINIASGGRDITLERTLANISRKYNLNKAQMRKHVFTNSYCKVDGKILSVAATAFRNEATDLNY